MSWIDILQVLFILTQLHHVVLFERTFSSFNKGLTQPLRLVVHPQQTSILRLLLDTKTPAQKHTQQNGLFYFCVNDSLSLSLSVRCPH